MRLTKRNAEGQVIMDCQNCELNMRRCTAYACRNRLKDRLAEYEDKEQPTWISCEERLPKPYKDVLVYDKTAEQVTCGCLSFLGEWFGVPMKNAVTHWMPMPQPPKGDE